MAFHTPGGGEIQLLKYKEYLEKKNVQVDLIDLWNPNFKSYDVFHYFSCISGSSHICNFVKRLGIPVVISSSLWMTKANKNNYPVEEIKAQLLLANKVITNSLVESEQLSSTLGIKIDSFEHVYNGIDPLFSQDIDPSIFRRYYKINEPFILNVGNIEPRKNQLALAEVAKQLNIKLILIGHIRDAAYADEIFLMHANTVQHLGVIPHSELLVSAYKSCEVFCLPSILETPGLAALEAAAAGAKVVITSEGSTYEYFGNSVIYVNPYSNESIKSKIQQALMAKGLKDRFQPTNFYWCNTIDRLIAIYKSLL